jgi:hypothetical protein
VRLDEVEYLAESVTPFAFHETNLESALDRGQPSSFNAWVLDGSRRMLATPPGRRCSCTRRLAHVT